MSRGLWYPCLHTSTCAYLLCDAQAGTSNPSQAQPANDIGTAVPVSSQQQHAVGPYDDEAKPPAEVDLSDNEAQPMPTSLSDKEQSLQPLSGDTACQTAGPSSTVDPAAHPEAASGDIQADDGDETRAAAVPNDRNASLTTPLRPEQAAGLLPNQEGLARMVGDYGDDSPSDHQAVHMSDDEPEAGEILMSRPDEVPPQPVDHMDIDQAEPEEPVAGEP